MIRRPPRSTHCISSAASDVYKRQYQRRVHGDILIGSMVFIGIWIAGTIFFAYYVTIRTKEPQYKAENHKQNTVVSVAIAVFCLWLMWICTYLHQMFPLLLPQRIQENKSSLIL
eukprot:TRINITY_DN4595_c0_g1_i4.p3 TRINITY_DN4595_c0_g1~~TRINITY_DN4595_c0_g1_i4.p3  ORF type:complete len:114 (+),score=32.08 TRINITY_DN4595_c0_g1_i4:112-453(+)